MKSQTSLVASKVRLRQWAELVQECQSRPAGMKVDTWCNERGISKANYYYRLRRVREAYLEIAQTDNASGFVELSAPNSAPQLSVTEKREAVAILHAVNGLTIEINSGASPEIIQSLVGALAYAK